MTYKFLMESNVLERERLLKHQIRQERNPRARKHLHKLLREIQYAKIPVLKPVN